MRLNNLGGATISLNYLVKYLEQQEVDFEFLDTQYFLKGWRRLLNPLYIIWSFLFKIRKIDIVFVNVSQFGTKTIAPVLFVLTKLFGKKFVFRPFGGAMQDHYEKYAPRQKVLFKNTLLKSDVFYLQTKALVQYFKPLGKNILQLKTSRYEPDRKYLRPDRPYAKRFIFLGHIKESKGVDYLLEAAKILGQDYTIHIYGSIEEDKYYALLKDSPYYKGVLKKEEVLGTLQNYDVLVLPTHYRGEGYPGALIEAYSLGLPVIATDWRAISEIVEEGKTGVLIPVKSSEKIAEAMQTFSPENYSAFSRSARSYFIENFKAETVSQQIIEVTEAL